MKYTEWVECIALIILFVEQSKSTNLFLFIYLLIFDFLLLPLLLQQYPSRQNKDFLSDNKRPKFKFKKKIFSNFTVYEGDKPKMAYKKRKIATSPFEVHSIIGFNAKVPIMNLTSSDEQPIIAYASGHILTILDCKNNRNEFILGHERDIVFIGTGKACKVLATSDENLVNIWERIEKKNGELDTVLVKTFNQPSIDEPILSTGLSVDGEYLVVASQKYVKFWILRDGNEKPDGFYELKDDFRIGSKIVFCQNKNQSTSFVLTTETNLLFCRWNVQQTALETHSPKPFPGVRQITDSSYCTNYCKGVSITKRSLIVWSDTSPSREIKRNVFKNRMEFQFEMKLGFYQLHTVTCCNGFIVISDSKGELKFYDENMKLYFLYDLFGQIVSSVSFVDRENENCESQNGCCCKDVLSMEDFFVSCENGRMYKCNLNAKPLTICDSAAVLMTCFDLHPQKDFLCGGRHDGSMFMYDYSTSKYDKWLSLPLEISKQLKLKPEHNASTCLSFSSCGRYVAAGTSNGFLAILSTITFTLFQKPLQLAEANVAIEKVIFSGNNELIVYRDESCKIGLLHFEKSWKLISKCRVHDSPIVYMSFRETEHEIGLVAISEDYKVADYTIRSTNNKINLTMNSCTRVDFLSVLKSCIMLKKNTMAFPRRYGSDEAYLTTDESFKFRIRSRESFDIINTFAAPISADEPITMMCHVQRQNENAVAFSHKNIIGLQHLPIDGNPSKYLAMVGHSRKTVFMKVSHCHKYLFTIGENDSSVYIWKIKMSGLLKQYESGGTSLRPFCNLIPGGVTGQLFKQMQDLFFYIQIKTQMENSTDPEQIKLIDGIPISEAVDFMQCIGYFPSESKVEYIMKEMKFYVNDTADDDPIITFENLIKLFVNYRPPFGYLKSDIHQTLVYLGYSYTMQSRDTEITRERLIEICTVLGEDMNENDAAIFLNRLDGRNNEIDNECDTDRLDNIRSVYTIPEFFKYILGVE